MRENPAPTTPSGSPSPTRTRPRVLIVTTDASVGARVIADLGPGYDVAPEHGPRSALGRLHDEVYDALVIDTGDRLDREQALALIEIAGLLDRPVPVVALAASLDDAEVDRLRAAGASTVLHRHVMVAPMLRTALRRVLTPEHRPAAAMVG